MVVDLSFVESLGMDPEYPSPFPLTGPPPEAGSGPMLLIIVCADPVVHDNTVTRTVLRVSREMNVIHSSLPTGEQGAKDMPVGRVFDA